MILTGKRIGGVQAGAWGMCERVVDADADADADGAVANADINHGSGHDPPAHQRTKRASDSIREKVDQEAISFALELCKGAPLATTAALRAVRGWQDAGLSEARAYEDVVRTKDRDEALAAFREKRRPVFEGR